MLWLHGCEARLSLPASLLSPGPVSDHLPTPGSGSGESFEAQHRSVLHSVTLGPLLRLRVGLSYYWEMRSHSANWFESPSEENNQIIVELDWQDIIVYNLLMILGRTLSVDVKHKALRYNCRTFSPNWSGPGHDRINRIRRTDPNFLASSIFISWFIWCLRFLASRLKMMCN